MSLLDVFLDAQKHLNEPVGPSSLIAYLDSELPSTQTDAPMAHDAVIRVSHLINLCPREEALRASHNVDRTKRVDRSLRAVFDIGKAFHTLVQNEWLSKVLIGGWRCPRCGVITHSEGRPEHGCGEPLLYVEPEILDPSIGVIGHADGVVRLGGKKYVIELKTINSFLFSALHNGPQRRHVLQAAMYTHLLGTDGAVILYFNKDDASLREFFLAPQPAVVGQILSRLQETRTAIKERRVPDSRICENKSCARAKSCPVRQICFSKG